MAPADGKDRAGRGVGKVRQLSMLIKLLKYICDTRLVWDVMGSVYNRRIYNAIAELYDHIVRELEMAEPLRILDAGAGRGYVSFLLATRNPHASVIGIDYSPMQVLAAEKLRQKRQIANCSFRRGNVMDIRFDDEIFDAAVSIGSIKHWPDDLRGLKEIRRVLKPGAWCVISETDQGAKDEAIRQFIRRFHVWFIPDGLLFWGLRHVIFGQSYTQEKLESLVRLAGFRNVEHQQAPTCPYVIIKAQK
jgi:ubiquinone/menaquinone biosynthesis C-methylase UbiE